MLDEDEDTEDDENDDDEKDDDDNGHPSRRASPCPRWMHTADHRQEYVFFLKKYIYSDIQIYTYVYTDTQIYRYTDTQMQRYRNIQMYRYMLMDAHS